MPMVPAKTWRATLIMAVLLAVAAPALTEDPAGDRLASLKALLKDGKYALCESEALALLSEVETRNGAEAAAAADVLTVLVEALWRGGKARQQETIDLGLRALEIRERTLAPGDPGVALAVNNLANVHLARNDYLAARALFERALAIREAALGPEHPDVASTLGSLANTYAGTGDFAAARPLSERSLAIREAALGPDHELVAGALNNLGLLLRVQGEHDAARAAHERALAIQLKIFGPDHPAVAASTQNLALALRVSGYLSQAVRLFEQALAIREKTLGPEHPEVGKGLHNLANALREMGDYAAARPLCERALAIREKAFGPDDPADVAATLDNLGFLMRSTGDYDASLALHRRALANREKGLGEDNIYVAISLLNIGRVLHAMGDHAAARQALERALALSERVLGPDHPDVATTLNDLATVLLAMGEPAAARPLCERGLAIREKELGPDHPNVQESLSTLADILVATGDRAAARPLYERCVTLMERVFGHESRDVAVALYDLARLRAALGETAGAFDQALEAERIARAHLQLTSRGLGERQSLQFAAIRPPGLDLALTLLRSGADGETRRRAWDGLVRSRALVFDEMAVRRRAVGGAADPEVARRDATLAAARERLAGLVVRGAGSQDPASFRKDLDEARGAMETAERLLAEASVPFARELSRGRTGLDAVASGLPADAALVAFAQYRKIDFAGKAAATPSFLAFVLRAGQDAPAVIDLGPAGPIDAAVQSWAREAGGASLRAGGPPSDAETKYRDEATGLRARVWDPVAAAIGEAARVFVVPDGSLSLVNLAALPHPEGGYLVERGPVLHHLSAERDLVMETGARRGAGLLAVGAPGYDATSMFASLRTGGKEGPSSGVAARGPRPSCEEFASVRFEPLPASGLEADEVARLWRRYGSDAAGAEVVDLRAAAASEAALKRLAPGRRALHLATHGFFLGSDCVPALSSGRGIGGLSGRTGAERTESPRPSSGGNPLLLSGIVLAGANHRAAAGSGEEDGILTAEEIASLDLSGVEWAVLSACETGVGDVRSREGVFGLSRAFRIAGVGTLIMSLWSVDDDSTRAWMKSLYRGRLEQRRDTAEAVRQASVDVLTHRRKTGRSTHPFYWAAFVAAGDWR